MVKHILLIRPEYPYGKPQLWMPTDLYKIAARFESVGIEATVADRNIEQLPENIEQFDFIGIAAFGTPYIPSSLNIAKDVFSKTGKKPILGGQIIEQLSVSEFSRIYGKNSLQSRNDNNTQQIVGVRALPAVGEVNIKEQLEKVPPEKLKQYLQNEFSLYVSQGCKYACNFCTAVRRRGKKRVRETFSTTVGEDLDAILLKTAQLDMKQVKIYLSPLDAFQNPADFKKKLEEIIAVKKRYDVQLQLRVLSRIDSFINALQAEPYLAELVQSAGISIIGFGVDGSTEEVWRSQHKGYKSLRQVDEAFSQSKKLGITPEALLVMGYHSSGKQKGDTKESLQKTVSYAINRAEELGVVARPHIAKDFVPGNDGWNAIQWQAQKEIILNDPKLFKNLDFVAFASELTHPDPEFRALVNDAYLQIIKRLTPQGLCTTSPLQPYMVSNSFVAEAWNKAVDMYNKEIPFDR
ncbi:hypothetical protein HZA96_02505 [Candidatus Woesearchaeota archaeon]|nr:hypothetical protein [Candidatus Woesearchaeota archaeon]